MPRPRKVRTRRHGDPDIAVAYVRVSTDKQALGPEAQRKAIERWCKRYRIRIAEFYVDDESNAASGESLPTDRQGFLASLEGLTQHNAGWWVAFKRTRVSRMQKYVGHAEVLIEQHGGRLMTTEEKNPRGGDTIEAEMMRTFRDLNARMELENIRRHIRGALAVKKSRGERVGSCPYGWTTDGGKPAKLVPVEAEQAAITRARALWADATNVCRIARVLTQEGYPTRGGRNWHHQTVRRILGIGHE